MREINKKIRVAIIGNHCLIRELIRRVLENEKAIDIVLEAESQESTIDAIQRQKAQVILLDITSGKSKKLEFLSQNKQALSDARIIVAAPNLSKDDIKAFIEADARGHILGEHSKMSDIASSVFAVAKGELWVDRKITASLLVKTLESLSNPVKTDEDSEEKLSQREKEVLELIAKGYPNKKIADLLFISDKTVKCHIYNIFKKLGVNRRVEALVYALQHGILRQDDI